MQRNDNFVSENDRVRQSMICIRKDSLNREGMRNKGRDGCVGISVSGHPVELLIIIRKE